MNSLSLGFFFVVGLSWALVDACIFASNGNWTPLALFLIGFTVMFAVLGCLPLSDKTVNKAGSVFAVILGASLVLFAFGSFSLSFGGLIKVAIALVFLVFGILSFFTMGDKEEAHH